MGKFQLPPKIKFLSQKRPNPQTNFRMEEDILIAFHNLLSQTTISKNALISSMIRHCLNDLGFLDKPNEGGLE